MALEPNEEANLFARVEHDPLFCPGVPPTRAEVEPHLECGPAVGRAACGQFALRAGKLAAQVQPPALRVDRVVDRDVLDVDPDLDEANTHLARSSRRYRPR